MITFKIEDKNYKIRTITISDYYRIKKHLLLDHLAEKYEMLSQLTGCPLDDIAKIPYNELIEIFALLEIMVRKSLLDEVKVANKISLHGVEYGLVDFDRMTLGEFSDLDVLVNDPNADNKLHEMMAILYRPISKQRLFSYDVTDYDMVEYKERCRLFLDLPLKHTKAVTTFFLLFDLASSGATETFLKASPKERKKMKAKINKVLADTGTQQLPYLQIVIRLKYKRLHNWVSEKLSILWLGLTTKIAKLNLNLK